MMNIINRQAEVRRLEAERNRLLIAQAVLDAELRGVGKRLAAAYFRLERLEYR